MFQLQVLANGSSMQQHWWVFVPLFGLGVVIFQDHPPVAWFCLANLHVQHHSMVQISVDLTESNITRRPWRHDISSPWSWHHLIVDVQRSWIFQRWILRQCRGSGWGMSPADSRGGVHQVQTTWQAFFFSLVEIRGHRQIWREQQLSFNKCFRNW